jgi:FkbM family methyltransferase
MPCVRNHDFGSGNLSSGKLGRRRILIRTTVVPPTFEQWESPSWVLNRWDWSRAVNKLRRMKRGWRRLAAQPVTVDDFLTRWFSRAESKTVIQIGANDGVQNDPLREFLKRPGNYTAILVEPLPYYASRLRELYAGRPDITIVEAAIGAEAGTRRLYFIPPEIADQMDGDGPRNRWAHGQGSSELATVEHWIRANAFRGDSYRQRIPFFLQSIAFADVPLTSANVVLSDGAATAGDTLLVVDVQGAELDVLKSVNWSQPPRWVVVEDDLGRGEPVTAFLEGHGYRHICGDCDKVFGLSAADRRARQLFRPLCQARRPARDSSSCRRLQQRSRGSDQPSRPNASSCDCLVSSKTLLMAINPHPGPPAVNASALASWWPVFRCPRVDAGFGCPLKMTEAASGNHSRPLCVGVQIPPLIRRSSAQSDGRCASATERGHAVSAAPVASTW